MPSIIIGEVSEFESAAQGVGVSLRATQLVRGEAHIQFGFVTLGHAILSDYATTRELAFEWQARPQSLNFSLRVGRSALLLEGKSRGDCSILMYVEPGNSSWTGRVVPTLEVPSPSPSYHVSLPLHGASILGMPAKVMRRGWLELPLRQKDAEAFVLWANLQLSGKAASEEPQDELYWWLHRLLEPALVNGPEPHSPSHYSRLIHAINNLLDAHPGRVLSVTGLAEELNVSVRTLQRAYRTTYGVGVSQYLRNRRLKRAHDLLRTGASTVHRAAHESGFHHVPRFSQRYRELFGVYPSDTLLAVR